MLYQLREMQRAFLNPLSEWAEASAKLYNNPYNPMSFAPMAKRWSAGFELMHRLGKEYEKPGWDLRETLVDGKPVLVYERIEAVKPFCRLVKFERAFSGSAKRAKDPTVLLFAPLSGHHATLLRDTVRALLPNHEVYVTDWIDARLVPLSSGAFHLDDYVSYCMEFIRLLGPDVHLISVCQPTVPVMAAVSILSSMKDPAVPKSMTMMGGPIDCRKSPTAVNNLATKHSYEWFENNLVHTVPNKYPGAGRKVYPGFLQHTGFVAMNTDRHMKSHWDFYQDLVRGDLQDAESHRQFYDEYNAVLDLPGEYYLDTVKTVFQDHALPTGTWTVMVNGRAHQVSPEDITKTRLFTIEGELDDISGSGQTFAAHDLCSGIKKANKQHLTAPGAGHYGIFSGRRWRDSICPEIAAFIRKS
jgi:poly(3-hydroxybutyrate) depolymerase